MDDLVAHFSGLSPLDLHHPPVNIVYQPSPKLRSPTVSSHIPSNAVPSPRASKITSNAKSTWQSEPPSSSMLVSGQLLSNSGNDFMNLWSAPTVTSLETPNERLEARNLDTPPHPAKRSRSDVGDGTVDLETAFNTPSTSMPIWLPDVPHVPSPNRTVSRDNDAGGVKTTSSTSQDIKHQTHQVPLSNLSHTVSRSLSNGSDMDALRALLRRQIPMSSTAIDGLASGSAVQEKPNAEPSYIVHFSSESSAASEEATPTPRPRRRRHLLNELAATNAQPNFQDSDAMLPTSRKQPPKNSESFQDGAALGNTPGAHLTSREQDAPVSQKTFASAPGSTTHSHIIQPEQPPLHKVTKLGASDGYSVTNVISGAKDPQKALVSVDTSVIGQLSPRIEQYSRKDLRIQQKDEGFEKAICQESDTHKEDGADRISTSTMCFGANGEDDFARRLRALREQDVEKNALLGELHQEVQRLRKLLQERKCGSRNEDPRAEAAEQRLMEARERMQRQPFVYVLIDGKGYDFYDDLILCGRLGGLTAADRLITEIRSYLLKFLDAKDWVIKVQLYMDVGSLQAKYSREDSATQASIADFTYGFMSTTSGLVDVVNVSEDRHLTHWKFGGLFHLLANNVHCKRVFFGGCNDNIYATLLEDYAGDPIIASRITLLTASREDEYMESLPFEKIELLQVFQSSASSVSSPERYDATPPASFSGPFSGSPTKSLPEFDAVLNWRETAKDLAGSSSRRYSSDSPHGLGRLRHPVLLNVEDERVDPPPEEEDQDTKENMLDRMELKHFCTYFHLFGLCSGRKAGGSCKFRHEPRLNKDELVVLRNSVKRMPCSTGSYCRVPDCVFGHMCQYQPGCDRGSNCRLAKFHGVDKTVVRVWRPSRSPRGTPSGQREV